MKQNNKSVIVILGTSLCSLYIGVVNTAGGISVPQLQISTEDLTDNNDNVYINGFTQPIKKINFLV